MNQLPPISLAPRLSDFLPEATTMLHVTVHVYQLHVTTNTSGEEGYSTTNTSGEEGYSIMQSTHYM